MKKIKKIICCLFLSMGLCACSVNRNEHTVNGHQMGVKINENVYEFPLNASQLVEKGFLFNNMKFDKKAGEDYLFNGTSKTPEFMIRYEFQKGEELSYKNCEIVGITSDLYGSRTKITTPEGLGLKSTKEKIKKVYGTPTININNEIYVYLDEKEEYCYIFESDMFYYGKISKSEIKQYKALQ